MNRKILLSAILTGSALLASCGGGGGSDSTSFEGTGNILPSSYTTITGQISDGTSPQSITTQDYQIGSYTLRYISAMTVDNDNFVVISSEIDNDGKFQLTLLKDKNYVFTLFDTNGQPVVSSIGKSFEIKDNDFVTINLVDSDNDGTPDTIRVKPSNDKSIIEIEKPDLSDNDGDNIPDVIKRIDRDKNGIPDIEEFIGDKDNDGKWDSAEDMDNDHIPDIIQDHDKDGKLDVFEDEDNDGKRDIFKYLHGNRKNHENEDNTENRNDNHGGNNHNHDFMNDNDSDMPAFATIGGSIKEDSYISSASVLEKYIVAYMVDNDVPVPIVAPVDNDNTFRIKLIRGKSYIFGIFDTTGTPIAFTEGKEYRVLGNNAVTMIITDYDNDGLKDEIIINPVNKERFIPENLDILMDRDHNSVPDMLDNDMDMDGMEDFRKAFMDTDGNGIPDAREDKDNDGIPDIIENRKGRHGQGGFWNENSSNNGENHNQNRDNKGNQHGMNDIDNDFGENHGNMNNPNDNHQGQDNHNGDQRDGNGNNQQNHNGNQNNQNNHQGREGQGENNQMNGGQDDQYSNQGNTGNHQNDNYNQGNEENHNQNNQMNNNQGENKGQNNQSNNETHNNQNQGGNSQHNGQQNNGNQNNQMNNEENNNHGNNRGNQGQNNYGSGENQRENDQNRGQNNQMNGNQNQHSNGNNQRRR